MERIINILLKDNMGKIVLCNIISSIEEKILSIEVIKEFFRQCVQRYEKRGNVQSVKQIIKIFEEVALNFLFQCSQSPCKKEVINITTYENFTENFIDGKTFPYVHLFNYAVWNPEDELDKDFISKQKFKDSACLGGNPSRPFFWISPNEDINNTSSPDDIRNLLGLVHYNNEKLIKFIIKAEDIKDKVQARPTFIEGCGHRRFKIRHNSSCKDWGYTVNLDLLSRGEANIDGVKERIVSPILLKEIEVKIKCLGACGDSPECTDEKFGLCICKEWNNTNTLREKLMRYLNES